MMHAVTPEIARIGQVVLEIALCALLLVAAVGDVRRYIIPNRLCLGIALLAPLYWLCFRLHPATPAAAGRQATGAVNRGFRGAGRAFRPAGHGGGDVKLMAALALWLPLGAFGHAAYWTALTGAIVAAAVIVRTRLNPQAPAKFLWGGNRRRRHRRSG
ncbi:prepilin peptidase [Hankyongella ginsenosidimutans]|nr:A24 family peptidase [Hankyongella ginsenosidimutans]